MNISGTFRPVIGYEQITSMSAAKTLTPPSGANYAEVQIEAGRIRSRIDGTAPTASVGWLHDIGEVLAFGDGQPLTVVKFIAVDSAAVLNVYYYNV